MSWDYLPVILCLQSAVDGRTWIEVIDEHDAMPNEDVIVYGHSFADEAVRRNLAAISNDDVFLDLDKCANLRFIAQPAAIKIDEIGLKDLYAMAQDYVGRNRH